MKENWYKRACYRQSMAHPTKVGNYIALRKHAHAMYSNFSRLKNDNFQMKNCDFFILAHNIDCGYTLEPPR